MKKFRKNVIYSLLAGMLLSSSVANAATYDLTNLYYTKVYNSYSKVYTINYKYNYTYNTNSNTQQNTVVNQYPKFNWTIINTKPSTPTTTTKPTNPVPTTPTTTEPTAPTTTTTPAKPVDTAPTASVSGLSAIETEVVRLVNIERQKEGLQPLVASTELSNVARKKSEDMALKNYFSHTSPTYGSPFDMMKSFGISYRTAGENIAKGQLTAQSVVNAWMNSSGHRANIMNPSFNKIGVGHFKSSNGTNYWTQMFTN
jgi:uncharacterized YkwD family protein